MAVAHVFFCLGLAALVSAMGPIAKRYHQRPSQSLFSSTNAGEPVYFTQYLNNPAAGRAAGEVTSIGNFSSYSGFFTVNATTENNLFIWYFPAQNGNTSAPLLIWLQGGPGGASTFGLFCENGPFSVDVNMNLQPNPYTWNQEYSMLFIDNPVGAGFSYTGTGNGWAADQDDVSRDLYTLMTQFYVIFPNEKPNSLYITGESYGGHYIPAFAAKIFEENSAGSDYINLVGVAIGDGWIDPYYQLQGYHALMWNLGLADESQCAVIDSYVERSLAAINASDWYDAFLSWDEMLNGDVYPYPNYFHNITGSDDYDNFMNTEPPASFAYYQTYLNQPSIRSAVHVGNLPFNDGHECEMHLLDDIMHSYKDDLATVMNNYKVILYNGQLDLIVGVPLTELFLPTVPWNGQSKYLSADRVIWKVLPSDVDVAGYTRTVDNFTQAVVRGAGHIVPYDQGRRALDMITRFVNNVPFGE